MSLGDYPDWVFLIIISLLFFSTTMSTRDNFKFLAEPK